ncbi:MAG: phosphatidate cytidylyltransferase [Parachlamydiales bacterium]
MGELKNRLIYGSLSIALLALFIWLGPYLWFRPIFGIALALIALTALWECYQLGKLKGISVPAPFAIGCGLFYLIVHYLQTQGFMEGVPHPSAIAIGFSLFALFVYQCAAPKEAIASLSLSLFGLLYTIVPLAWTLDLLYLTENGRWWLTFVIAVTVLTDIGAYLVGRTVGRIHPWPKLSPRKTLEGSLGGIAFGVGGALAMVPLYGPISYTTAAILGLVLAIVGQIGDLSESLLKRDAEVKDSNRLPGLGGMLDVVDSLLFNVPTTLFALTLL